MKTTIHVLHKVLSKRKTTFLCSGSIQNLHEFNLPCSAYTAENYLVARDMYCTICRICADSIYLICIQCRADLASIHLFCIFCRPCLNCIYLFSISGRIYLDFRCSLSFFHLISYFWFSNITGSPHEICFIFHTFHYATCCSLQSK